MDAHVCAEGKVAEATAEACNQGWRPGTYLSEAFDALDLHPEAFTKARREGGIRRGKSTYKGLNWPLRVFPDRPGYVQAGSCARDFAHWSEPRLLTIRELGRMMGYPDSWRWPQGVTKSSLLIGKCCPVPSGRWISSHVARALDREPGRSGKEIGHDEYLHDSTHAYKRWL